LYTKHTRPSAQYHCPTLTATPFDETEN
jgi:hypothetical protein